MKARKNKGIKVLKYWIRDILIAVIIVVFLTTFGVQNLRVVGNSMAPTLLNGHLVLINKIAYKFKAPKQGDVIGFYTPGVQDRVVKRIIGMPGDIIDYRDGMLYVNEVLLSYTEEGMTRDRGDIEYPYRVPENSYFVLGDNINSSIDSRYKSIGRITKEQIIGKIKLRVWPFWIKPLLE